MQSINRVELYPIAKYIKYVSTALKLNATAGKRLLKDDSSRVSGIVQKMWPGSLFHNLGV